MRGARTLARPLVSGPCPQVGESCQMRRSTLLPRLQRANCARAGIEGDARLQRDLRA
jgi:hypothetical protein